MRTKLFILILALQSLWVLATVAVQEHKLRSGQEILLETRPVDPRDLLRGDYMTLAYEITEVPRSAFIPVATNQPAEGTPVFVRLQATGKFFMVQNASFTPLTAEKGHPVLRGKINNRWMAGHAGETLRVEYGLEKYFVPEGMGNPAGKLTVAVAVTSSGNAIIKRLYVDGKPFGTNSKDPKPE